MNDKPRVTEVTIPGYVDPRDPDYSREGRFVWHNCWRCNNGNKPCVQRDPSQCEYLHARND